MTTKPKRQYGQRPGTMHIDRRAKRLLADPVSEGPDDELLTTKQVAGLRSGGRLPSRSARSPGVVAHAGPRLRETLSEKLGRASSEARSESF